ncbi:MAG: hypothetical protein KDD64_08690 [Bdellovibrionales bacterium]|nr:hypothetical protein [Bdellovibrionales bacterium]
MSKGKVSVIGSGTMGRGIAQIAATNSHDVIVVDTSEKALQVAKSELEKVFARLVEKGKVSPDDSKAILSRIAWESDLKRVKGSTLVIEAVVENLEVKRMLMRDIESTVAPDSLLASNTSSLSIASIASACENPERVLGLHFFNPAPLLPLVEVIPGITSGGQYLSRAVQLMKSWGKAPVEAKDTPGFIVNRVARPFYGESLRILEEGVADCATIDWALKEIGKFRMGPFELMDLIGNDINLKVTETVFEAFFFDPRFRPSFVQKRMVEAGLFGRKSGRGYYDYREGAAVLEPNADTALGQKILERVLAMLINEAIDAVFMNITTPEGVDLAMTKGVNYPKGLLRWGEEWGLGEVLSHLESLQEEYGEDRYRPNPLLRRYVREGRRSFFQ